jgi:hypothetical protein
MASASLSAAFSVILSIRRPLSYEIFLSPKNK